MPASLDTAEIVQLLQEYEQLSQDGNDGGPILAILSRETRFPNLEQFLRAELLENRRGVDEIAGRLFWYSPPVSGAPMQRPRRTLGSGIARGVFFGASAGVSVWFLVGFVFGGLSGAVGPCGTAPNFMAGAAWGAIGIFYFIGFPVLAVSCILGAFLGATTPERR